MGIPGLWKELEAARTTRSLTHMAVVDGFEKNKQTRGFRIGIDASLWFFHAQMQQVREGENPELRMFFFRCCKLLTAPFLPLFVFDGPGRPQWKRGQRVGKKDVWMVPGAKNIIEAFGYEWRMAPGEAEAELAYLNRIGLLDAVLTDDVDAFLFGAETIIRNPSLTLTGNISKKEDLKNSAGKFDDNHAFVYKSSALLQHEDIKLTRGGLILIGLLNGGDYHEAGLVRCGLKIAHGLAKAGFGDSLFEAASASSTDEVHEFLESWRVELIQELRTNKSGFLKTKQVKLASQVPSSFPDMTVLMSYVRPLTSEMNPGRIPDPQWVREPDIGKLAGVCELYFEWGVKEVIVHRFKTNVWPGVLCRALRRGALDAYSKRGFELGNISAQLARSAEDENDGEPSTPRKNRTVPNGPPIVPGTPSSMIARHFSSLAIGSPKKRRPQRSSSDPISESSEEETEEYPILTEITMTRTHASTDGILEYRMAYDPRSMVLAAEAGVKGIRPPLTVGFFSQVCTTADGGNKGEEYGLNEDMSGEGELIEGDTIRKMKVQDKNAFDKVWLPACMVNIVEKELVGAFEDKKANKVKKKTAGTRTKKKTKDKEIPSDEENVPKKKTVAKPRGVMAPKSKSKPRPPPLEEEEEEEDSFGGFPPSPSKKAKSQTNGSTKDTNIDALESGLLSSPGNITSTLKKMQSKKYTGSKEISRPNTDVGNPFITSQAAVSIDVSDDEESTSRKTVSASIPVPSKTSPKKRSRSALERAIDVFSAQDDNSLFSDVKQISREKTLSPKSWLAQLEQSDSDSDLINFDFLKKNRGKKKNVSDPKESINVGSIRSSSMKPIGRSKTIDSHRAATEPVATKSEVIEISSDDGNKISRNVRNDPSAKSSRNSKVKRPESNNKTEVIDLT